MCLLWWGLGENKWELSIYRTTGGWAGFPQIGVELCGASFGICRVSCLLKNKCIRNDAVLDGRYRTIIILKLWAARIPPS